MRRTLVRLATPVTTPTATSFAKAAQAVPSSATAPGPKNPRKKSSKLKGRPLSLEHFLLRSRVLHLYRTIVRAIYQIPDKEARRDPIAHAKGEFARNKDVKETDQIRYLVSTGKAEWDGMRRYVEEMALRGK